MNSTEPILSPFDEFTPFQVKFVSVASKVPALLSLWGSFYIIHDIIGTKRARQKRLKNAFHRIMLGLSIFDCIISFFAWFLTTWPQPKDTIHSNFLWGNVGNDATCEAQGFMTQIGGHTTANFTAMLTIYYLLTVKYSWKEKDFRKIEPFLYFVVIGSGIASATTLLVKGLFNPGMPMCYTNSYPLWCDGEDCIRGANEQTFDYALFIIPVTIDLFIIVFCMGILVLHTKRQETRIMGLYTNSNERVAENNKLTKIVFKRALRYVGVFLFIWLPTVIFTILIKRAERKGITKPNAMFAIVAVMSFISPLQGLFNALIYSRSTLWMFIQKSKRLICCSEEEKITVTRTEESSPSIIA